MVLVHVMTLNTQSELILRTEVPPPPSLNWPHLQQLDHPTIITNLPVITTQHQRDSV